MLICRGHLQVGRDIVNPKYYQGESHSARKVRNKILKLILKLVANVKTIKVPTSESYVAHFGMLSEVELHSFEPMDFF